MIAILAQRLVRTICPRCKVKYNPPESVLADSGIPREMIRQAEFAKGKGCTYCQRSGYRGRLGIYELMLINSKIRDMMFKNIGGMELRIAAMQAGMTTLYADGMRKVCRGITSFEEVYRVAKKTEQEDLAFEVIMKQG